MKYPQALHLLPFALMLSACLFLLTVPAHGAQDQPGQVQLVTGRLEAGETHVYRLEGLRAGDRISASMKTTSGNLDPALGITECLSGRPVDFGTPKRNEPVRQSSCDTTSHCTNLRSADEY